MLGGEIVKCQQFVAVLVERRSWRRRRRGSIRRVYLELIFLRDTLRARLATLGGRRLTLPSSKIADVERSNADGSISQPGERTQTQSDGRGL